MLQDGMEAEEGRDRIEGCQGPGFIVAVIEQLGTGVHTQRDRTAVGVVILADEERQRDRIIGDEF